MENGDKSTTVVLILRDLNVFIITQSITVTSKLFKEAYCLHHSNFSYLRWQLGESRTLDSKITTAPFSKRQPSISSIHTSNSSHRRETPREVLSINHEDKEQHGSDNVDRLRDDRTVFDLDAVLATAH